MIQESYCCLRDSDRVRRKGCNKGCDRREWYWKHIDTTYSNLFISVISDRSLGHELFPNEGAKCFKKQGKNSVNVNAGWDLEVEEEFQSSKNIYLSATIRSCELVRDGIQLFHQNHIIVPSMGMTIKILAIEAPQLYQNHLLMMRRLTNHSSRTSCLPAVFKTTSLHTTL